MIDHTAEVYTSAELADEIEEVLARAEFKKQFPFPVKDFIPLHSPVCIILKVIR